MENNQNKNQDDNQLDNQVENNLIPEMQENLYCCVFLEQVTVVNQLPLEERGKVLYLALLYAFALATKNQDDNQLECTYISTYKSLSLSLLSKSILDMFKKVIRCSKKSNNWGGVRQGAGRKRIIANESNEVYVPTVQEIAEYAAQEGKELDANKFWKYYDAAGWKDKNGNPINYKQSVIKWKDWDETNKKAASSNMGGLF